MSDRSTWATRIGFIPAAVGSAVGLGNIRQFPFETAANGGAAFLLVYPVAVVVIGLPATLAEFTPGRRTKSDAVDAFLEIGYPRLRYIGAFGVAVGFRIVGYYSVVGGWVLRYVVGSATGGCFGDPTGYFGAVAAGGETVAFHALFVAVTVGVSSYDLLTSNAYIPPRCRVTLFSATPVVPSMTDGRDPP